MSYNLFLDDQRKSSYLNDCRTWVTVRSYNEFVATIKEKGLPKFISFDHDLALEHYPIFENSPNEKEIPYNYYHNKTGFHCAKWLIEYCLENNLKLPDYQVHSMNPVGKENIIKLLEHFRNHQNKTL